MTETAQDPQDKEKAETQIQQLSMLENNLQNMSMQRQQFQSQIMETESALSELEASADAYKIIGNLMVRVEKEKLKSDLSHKKETVQVRIQSLEKQEQKLREKAKELQEQVLKTMR